jgi:hypothetical protein
MSNSDADQSHGGLVSVSFAIEEIRRKNFMPRTYIFVRQDAIGRNRRPGHQLEPPLAVRKKNSLVGKWLSSESAMRVRIDGRSSIRYRPDDPLKNGAKVFIETEEEVQVTIDPRPDRVTRSWKIHIEKHIIKSNRGIWKAFIEASCSRSNLCPVSLSLKPPIQVIDPTGTSNGARGVSLQRGSEVIYALNNAEQWTVLVEKTQEPEWWA